MFLNLLLYKRKMSSAKQLNKLTQQAKICFCPSYTPQLIYNLSPIHYTPDTSRFRSLNFECLHGEMHGGAVQTAAHLGVFGHLHGEMHGGAAQTAAHLGVFWPFARRNARRRRSNRRSFGRFGAICTAKCTAGPDVLPGV